MEAEDLILDHSCEGQEVKKISVVFPHVSVAIFAQALIVEAVDLRNLSGLVVAAQDRDPVLKADLQGHEQGDSLYRVVATVNVVTHEEVVGIGGASANLKELHEIVELAVYIAANGDWTLHRLHIALLREDFASLYTIMIRTTYLVAQGFHFELRDGLVVKQLLDLSIKHGDLVGTQ